MKLVHNSVVLKTPKYEELYLTEQLLACPKTMEFNNKWGGIVLFPETKWEAFYNNYVLAPTAHYFHVYNLDMVFVGEISTKYRNEFKSDILNLKIMHQFRGNHHGSDALVAMLQYLFDDVGIDMICDNVALDNHDAVSLLESFGFEKSYTTKEYVMMVLKKEDFY